jgi:hypothetical protein
MVAFRFAELFFTQAQSVKATEQMLETFEDGLDKILLDINVDGKSENGL